MKVKHVNFGLLKGENNEVLCCDGDGFGNVMDLGTGELYKVIHRDNDGYPTEIKPL